MTNAEIARETEIGMASVSSADWDVQDTVVVTPSRSQLIPFEARHTVTDSLVASVCGDDPRSGQRNRTCQEMSTRACMRTPGTREPVFIHARP